VPFEKWSQDIFKKLHSGRLLCLIMRPTLTLEVIMMSDCCLTLTQQFFNHDCMFVGFPSTYVICVYLQSNCKFHSSQSWGILTW
jgi:hypothetical protein